MAKPKAKPKAKAGGWNTVGPKGRRVGGVDDEVEDEQEDDGQQVDEVASV